MHVLKGFNIEATLFPVRNQHLHKQKREESVYTFGERRMVIMIAVQS